MKTSQQALEKTRGILIKNKIMEWKDDEKFIKKLGEINKAIDEACNSGKYDIQISFLNEDCSYDRETIQKIIKVIKLYGYFYSVFGSLDLVISWNMDFKCNEDHW